MTEGQIQRLSRKITEEVRRRKGTLSKFVLPSHILSRLVEEVEAEHAWYDALQERVALIHEKAVFSDGRFDAVCCTQLLEPLYKGLYDLLQEADDNDCFDLEETAAYANAKALLGLSPSRKQEEE